MLEWYADPSSVDFLIDLWPTGNVIVSGSGTFTVSGIDVLIKAPLFHSMDEALLPRLYAEAKLSNYLDPVPIPLTSTTLTASATNTFILNQLVGKATHGVMMIRAAGASATTSGWMTMYNVGASATIDIQSPGGTSIWGGGGPMPVSYLMREWWCENFPSSFSCNKPFITLPLTGNIQKAYKGSPDGFMEFKGDSKKLVLNLGPAPTAEVQTFTVTGTAASGYYRLSFRGEYTQPLAYSASASAMQTAFNALKSAQARSITVVFNQALSAGTFTGTFTCPETGAMPDLVMVDCMNLLTSAPAGVSVSTAVTTPGVAGIATGTYDIYLYFWVMRMAMCQYGRITTKLL